MALRDLMNNYFYGKQGKADFTLADLPQNRRQLFATVLKVRWSQMVGVNLLYLVIWIPAILWTMMNMSILFNLAEDARSGAPGIIMTWLLILWPCIAITGPFNAGVSYIMRNWSRDQHSFILSDFKDAIKENWKQALAVSVIDGAMPMLVYVSVYFYSSQMQNGFLFVVPMALSLLIGLLWAMAQMLMFPMMVTYELKLKDIIRNALLLTVGKLPWAVLFKLITLIVPALVLGIWALAPGAALYVLMAVSILYIAFMLAFNKLVTAAYANWLFETLLNPRIEGAPTNIGLRPENWDDTEYRPEDDEE
ncbi:MAG: DUF624 domain-containing protein [Clostridia bacterium]|nr:DUF624 domain-containing protein [Clostridia bacterium]